MTTCPPILYDHLARLSQHFRLALDDWYRFVIVQSVKLPPGFNRNTTDALIELEFDYPQTPPGMGNSRVFVDAGLRFRGWMLAEYREHFQPTYRTPGFGPWAWICYQRIHWNPLRDDLVTFVEMLRADLTNPPTK